VLGTGVHASVPNNRGFGKMDSYLKERKKIDKKVKYSQLMFVHK